MAHPSDCAPRKRYRYIAVRVTTLIAALSFMICSISLNAIAAIRGKMRPAHPVHTAFVIAIDTYPLEYGGDAYIVRYTLDGAYHAPDFRRHEDVATFIEHLKTIAAVDGLLDL